MHSNMTFRRLHVIIVIDFKVLLDPEMFSNHGMFMFFYLIMNFKVLLKKCRGKLDCLIFEMLLIKNERPKLNAQADSIRAKLFT